MIKKSGWLKNGTATPQGIVDSKGKILKSRRMTAEEIDAFNGVSQPEPEVVTVEEVMIEEPVVEEVIEEVEVVVEAPKPKSKAKGKKGSSFSRLFKK